MVAKARQNPERVRQVWDKIKTDGFWPTLEAVFARLDEPLALGYCNAGVVLEVGPQTEGFAAGDRVVSNGGHAQVVHRPTNLCAKIPSGVSDEEAAFAILGAIGLQGIRLLQPAIGESVAVIGLGLIGLLAVQMLVGSGVKVLGIDPDPARLELARRFGAQVVDLSAGTDPVAAGIAFSGGPGVDGVLITASAKNDQIVSQAARMSRPRGRIVLVGVVDLQLNRAEFYRKELTFQVSCSYGPGRYDPNYEEKGIDYPFAFVRWTEQRNIAAVLDLMASGRLRVAELITSRLAFAEAQSAYQRLTEDRTQLGIVLNYPDGPAPLERTLPAPSSPASSAAPRSRSTQQRVRLGVIGAGAFTTRVLLPALKKLDVDFVSIASANGLSGAHAARKFGFERNTTDTRTILADDAIDAVLIATRHNSHASLAAEALSAGKHVFVEKPLAIDRAGLDLVRQAAERWPELQLMVGFNRRFAPQIVKMRELLSGRSSFCAINILVNAGDIPPDHWTQDPRVGGGRLVGEGCHFIDLVRFLADSPIIEVQAVAGQRPGSGKPADSVAITLRMEDGSIGCVQYLANGHRGFPKERVEVLCEGKVLSLDNFRKLTGYGWSRFRKLNLFRQDKGHAAELAAFLHRVREGGTPLIPLQELINVTESTFAAAEAAAGPAGEAISSKTRLPVEPARLSAGG